MKIIFLICTLIISLESIAQKDSSVFCNQYFQAISYIRQDSFTKTAFQVNECKFKVSNVIKSGSLDYTFVTDLMSYVINKTNKLIDSIMIESIEKELTKYDDDYSTKINCIGSDDRFNLTLNFERVSDTIFIARIYEIESNCFIRYKNRNTKPFVEYLFIINRKNTIDKVFKRESYLIIRNTNGF